MQVKNYNECSEFQMKKYSSSDFYENIMKKLEGHQVYEKKVYLFQDAIYKEMVRLYGLSFKEMSKQDLEETYFQILLENKNCLESRTVFTFQDKDFEREIVTGIALPKIYTFGQNHIVYEDLKTKIYFNHSLLYSCVDFTNCFVFGKEIPILNSQVESYVRKFSQKKEYLELLKMLLVDLASCQSSIDCEFPIYVPDELIPYYLALKEEVDFQEELNKKIAVDSKSSESIIRNFAKILKK